MWDVVFLIITDKNTQQHRRIKLYYIIHNSKFITQLASQRNENQCMNKALVIDTIETRVAFRAWVLHERETCE